MGASTTDLSIRRESVISAASNVVIVAVQLGTLAVLSRTLGSAGLGVYFFAISTSMIAIIPSRELSEIMRKRVSEVDLPSTEFFGFAQFGTVLYLLLFAGVLALFAPLLVAQTPLTQSVIVAFGLYTACLTQSAMSTRLFDAVGSPGASMVSQSIRDAGFFGCILVLAWLDRVTPETVLLLYACIHLVASAGIYAVVGLVPQVPSRQYITSGVEFGKWSFPTGIASRLWEQVPTLLLGTMLGGSAVALYETAKRVTMAGAYLATCINDPLLVKVSAMDSADEDVVEYLRLALDYTPSVAIPALLVMAPVTSEILLVAAGPEFTTGGLVLLGVAAMHVLSGLKTPIASFLHGVDQPRYVFYLTAGTLVVGVPAIGLGAIGGGVEGVVLLLLALELAGVLVSEVAFFYVFDRFVLPETLHVQFGAATIAAAVVWAGSQTLDLTTSWTLGLVLAAALAVHYSLFALTSESFRRGTVRTVRDVSCFLSSVMPA